MINKGINNLSLLYNFSIDFIYCTYSSVSMGCTICGSTVKNPNTKSHISSNRHQTALGKPCSQKIGVMKSPKIKTTPKVELELEKILDRIKSLERNMNYTINKLNQVEGKLLLKSNEGSDSINQSSYVKQDILRKLPSRASITIDQLYRKLSHYPWTRVEKVLKDLVDDQIIDVADGNSSKKLYGKYGRIIRR